MYDLKFGFTFDIYIDSGTSLSKFWFQQFSKFVDTDTCKSEGPEYRKNNNQSDYYRVNSFYKDYFVVQNPKMKVESKFLPNGLVQGVLTKGSAGFFWVKIYPEKCDPSPRLLTQT